MVLKDLIIRAAFLTLIRILFLYTGWFLILDSQERGWVHKFVASRYDISNRP
jgi:hypothetical protein